MCRVEWCDEMAIDLTLKQPKARKAHKCTECGRQIEVGETYEYRTTLYDGSVSTHKTCSHCLVAREWLSRVCGGWVYGEVEDDIREHWREGYGMWIGRVAAGMNRLWRRRDGELMTVPELPESLPVGH